MELVALGPVGMFVCQTGVKGTELGWRLAAMH
jgi:hypothetical protein